jgi:hypothetical protein
LNLNLGEFLLNGGGVLFKGLSVTSRVTELES